MSALASVSCPLSALQESSSLHRFRHDCGLRFLRRDSLAGRVHDVLYPACRQPISLLGFSSFHALVFLHALGRYIRDCARCIILGLAIIRALVFSHALDRCILACLNCVARWLLRAFLFE